jgi:hypothetical protein
LKYLEMEAELSAIKSCQVHCALPPPVKERDQALKKEKWVRWNVIKHLSEMMASVSLENRLQRGHLPS